MTPDTQPSPENPLPLASLLLSPEQKAKMEAIEQASNLLDAAKVPFMILASPDDIKEGMKFTSAHRLSYATDILDIPKEVAISRSSLIGAALTKLSQGMKGGLSCHGADGKPICLFQDGRMLYTKTEPGIVV